MRVAIIILLLVCLPSLLISATADVEQNYFNKKVSLTLPTKNFATLFAAKKNIKNVKITSFQFIQRQQKQQNSKGFLARFNPNHKAIFLRISKITIQIFSEKIDYSAQYIFWCLYPKYSFW